MNKTLKILGGCLFLLFVYSVVRSGFLYQLDNDEIFHVNLLYQIANGAHPYTSFFTIYTPVFHWFLLPVYFLFGPTFTTFHVLRGLMIVLFLLRVLLTAILVRRVFSGTAAYIFAIFMFLDPFAVFSGMQIRPDSLMLCMVVVGFLFLQAGLTSKNTKHFFVSGVFFGLAVITIIKSVPLVAVTSFIFCIWALAKKQKKQVIVYGVGLLLPVVAFLLIYAAMGELSEMIRGVFFDPLILFQSLLFKTTLEFFYQPDNMLLYGASGKTLSWYFVSWLPYMGLLGVLCSLGDMWKKKRINIIQLILIVGLGISGLILYKSPYVFIQYLLSVNWLLALFAGVGFGAVYHSIHKTNLRNMIAGAFILLIVTLAISSFRANIIRATVDQKPLEESYLRIWQEIAEDVETFPNFLFRPTVYPLLIGSFYGDVPPSILARFGDIAEILENHQVQYLLLSEYYISFLPSHVQQYINDTYEITSIPEVYRRIR